MSYGVPPTELSARLTARDMADYRELYNRSPWGPWAEDVRCARGQHLAAISIPGRKGRRPRVEDFLLGSRPRVSREKRKAAFVAWATVAQAEQKRIANG